ncbi:hypothetical protein MFUM_970033 [Methylacidiphilum fumariolicum SolV]|uniref:Uncharacterized protein n=2 Tax=Candidatus Methylacidiphilum fumarolicum TaxID=591154 RepID=I0K194_METFB|nr:conserved protein of unknown function [Candidatus Methylacidiphilum fumarolicum]CCG93263.1 hypothetical protein MFUM_970033 [Methylacidiphilum fumariolicum SolV]
MQLFDDNGMQPSSEVGDELVSDVLPDIGDADIEPGQLGSCLFSFSDTSNLVPLGTRALSDSSIFS